MSYESLLLRVDVDIPFSTSDHSSIEFQMLAHTPKTLSYTTNALLATNKLDFDKIDHARLAAELLHTDWPSIFNFNDNIDYAWEKFSNHIMLLIAKFTPIKVSSVQPEMSHFPFELQLLIRMKKAAWSTFKKSCRETDKKNFSRLS